MAKGMELLLKLKSKLDNSVSDNFKKLGKMEKDLMDKKRKLAKIEKSYAKHQELVKKYKNEQILLEKNRSSLKKLEDLKKKEIPLTTEQAEKYKTLQREVSKMEKNQNKLRLSYEKSKSAMAQQKQTLGDLRNELHKTADSYKKLAAQKKIADKAVNLRSNIKEGMGNIGSKAINLAKKAAIGTTVAAAGGAAVLGKQSISTYLDFDQNMKKVKAISGASEEEYKKLQDTALKLGATTKFTGGEVAAAMEKMALAGFNTEQIIDSLEGVLDSAAASGEDVALVSDIITDNLTAFNLTAKDSAKFADVLAWGMSKTNVDIQMLGESFKYAASTAGGLGINLEQTVASLGLMGDQAIKSGMAGRGLNEVFSRLVKNQDVLARAGINVKNANGEFVGIVETVKQFERVTKNMSGMQKMEFLTNAFGEQGARAFSKLLSAKKTINGVEYTGAAAVEKAVEDATNNSKGLSKQMKDTMLQGASGAVTLLSSAYDTLKNAIGKKLFNEGTLSYIKKVTDYIGELANVINGNFDKDNKINVFWTNIFKTAKTYIGKLKEIFTPAKEALINMFSGANKIEIGKIIGDTILIIATAVSKLIQVVAKLHETIGIDNIVVFIATFMGVLKVVKVIKKVRDSFLLLREAGGVLSGLKAGITAFVGAPWLIVIAAVIAGIVLIYKNWDKVKIYLIKFGKILKDLAIKIGLFFLKITGPIGQLVVYIYKNWDKIVEITKELVSKIKNIFFSCVEWSKEAISTGVDFIITGMAAAFDFIKTITPLGTLMDLYHIIVECFSVWDSSKGVLENLKAVFGEFANKVLGSGIINFAKELYELWNSNLTIGEKIKETFTKVFDRIGESIMGVVDKVKNFGNTLANLPGIKSIIDWVSDSEENQPAINGSHAAGLDNVPFDGYIAELHKGERVLTRDENRQYGDLLVSLLGSRQNSIRNGMVNTQNTNSFSFAPNINIEIKDTSSNENIVQILEEKIKALEKEFFEKLDAMRRGEIDHARTQF